MTAPYGTDEKKRPELLSTQPSQTSQNNPRLGKPGAGAPYGSPGAADPISANNDPRNLIIGADGRKPGKSSPDGSSSPYQQNSGRKPEKPNQRSPFDNDNNNRIVVGPNG